MTDEQTDTPAHAGSEQVVLKGLEDVEYVTSALAIYIDRLTEQNKDAPPVPLQGPWHNPGNPDLFADCVHANTEDVTEFNDEGITEVLLCTRCGATRVTGDAMWAVRSTVKGAIELRQRIVKEWGYDPTHEG